VAEVTIVTTSLHSALRSVNVHVALIDYDHTTTTLSGPELRRVLWVGGGTHAMSFRIIGSGHKKVSELLELCSFHCIPSTQV